MEADVTTGAPRSTGAWLFLVEGIAAALLGFYLLFDPGATTLFLMAFLAFYWVISGAIRFFLSLFSGSRYQNRWWVFFGSILRFIAGLLILGYPYYSTVFSVTFLVYFVAFLAILGGVAEIASSGDEGKRSGWRIFGGFVYLLFGLALLFNSTLSGFLALAFVFGVLLIISGIGSIAYYFQVRSNPALMEPAMGSGYVFGLQADTATSDVVRVKAYDYLSGLRYPAHKMDILNHARSKGAGREVLEFLNELSDREYLSPAMLDAELKDLQ